MHKLYQRLGVEQEDRGLLTAMYFGFFCSGMMSIMLGSLLPYIKAAGALDYTRSGLLLSMHQAGNLGALFLAGFLSGRVGRKRSAVLLGSGMCLGLLLMTLTGNPALLLTAFALTGVARGSWSNICNTTVGQVSRNKAAALNVLHAVFAIGALLSPALVLAAVRLPSGGWRWAARFVALLGAVALVFVARSAPQGRDEMRPRNKSGSAGALLRSGSLWLVAGILFFYLGAEASIVGWFVTYFTEAGILPATAAAFTPTMLWFMIMLGRVCCASLSARMDRGRLVLGMALAFCGFFLVMLLAGNGAVSVVCLLGLGFSMAGIYPTVFSSLRTLSSTVANGMVLGIATAGAILMPSAVGVVADGWGLGGGVAVILASCLGMLALIGVKMARDHTPGKGLDRSKGERI